VRRRRRHTPSWNEEERHHAIATAAGTLLLHGRMPFHRFLALLEALGIDPFKDAETYHNARLGPGRHDYGGWFHFVGQLHTTGDFPVVDFGGGFTVSLCRAHAPPLTCLENMPLVQLEFHSDAVPWVLDEPEAE
jgi:hypothetical protein